MFMSWEIYADIETEQISQETYKSSELNPEHMFNGIFAVTHGLLVFLTLWHPFSYIYN